MKKRPLTLLEIMIVICLITLITGVVGYNMKGALDKGKRFRTEQAKAQLQDILLICLSEGKMSADEIVQNPEKAVENVGIAKNAENLVKDGWGEKFTVKLIKQKTDFSITSSHDEKN